jgi:hypothetical protein
VGHPEVAELVKVTIQISNRPITNSQQCTLQLSIDFSGNGFVGVCAAAQGSRQSKGKTEISSTQLCYISR